MIVVVFGAGGQLGISLQALSVKRTGEFHFFNSKQLDITDRAAVDSIFDNLKPNYCVNAAAYTAVDQAEIDKEQADLVNHIAVKYIAEACLRHDTTLVHISTDFVFDGEKNTPYTESDPTNPLGVYGETKRKGELEIERSLRRYFIIRTAWLYSDYGHNFKRTMLRLANEKNSLSVVNDQIGSPTNALDLAEVIFTIISSNSKQYGLYHFCNEGLTSWYGFAKKIFETNNVLVDLKGISTAEYPTLAKRPKYSVLDSSKIKKEFNISIRNWESALKAN
jgi:dTDP-4-dehydrorhamnose reductase